MGYPGTVTLGAETFIRILEDVGQSLLYHGFRKLVYINGNRIANLAPMEIAAVHLRDRFGAYVAIVDTGLVARNELSEIAESVPGGLSHAGESETSLMLYHHPELVNLALAGQPKKAEDQKYSFHHLELDSILARRDSITVKPTIEEMTEAGLPAGIHGDPTTASAGKGEKFHRLIVSNMVEVVRTIQALKVDLTNKVDVPI
jgi:creatinine amidohydrolase